MNVLSIVLAYFVGSIPTAYLLVKKKTGQDVRQIGSKNMGATNVFKSLGSKYGTLVFFIDFLKGACTLFFALYIFNCPTWAVMFSGVAAVLGHNYPVWLLFNGGKGAATASGVLVIYCLTQALFWQFSIFLLIVIIGYFLFKNLVSGATAAFAVMPLVFFFTGQTESGCFALAIMLIIAIRFVPPAWHDILRLFRDPYLHKQS